MDIKKKSKLFLRRFEDEWRFQDILYDSGDSFDFNCDVLSASLKMFAHNISSYGYNEGDVFDLMGFCLFSLIYKNYKPEAVKEEILRKLKDILDLVVKKNHDYGSAVFLAPCCDPVVPVDTAILVRLSDKFQRFWNLTNDNMNLIEETIEDTVKDVVGYLFLLWCIKEV